MFHALSFDKTSRSLPGGPVPASQEELPRRTGRTTRRKRILAALLLTYLVVATALSWTKAPICDEGWYADPAINLLQNGTMGSPVLEGAGSFLTKIDQYTYWIMPVHILVQAGWYKVFGAHLFALRSLSILAGLMVLLCWYVILRQLGASSRVALLTLLFAQMDTIFLALSATGRSDMLSLAFGAAAQASYLVLREKNFRWALFASHSLVVASGLTHPIGGMVSLGAILFFQVYFDRRRFARRDLCLVALPYGIGCCCWGAYILKQPEVFWAQFSGNAGERLRQLQTPAQTIEREFLVRFLAGYRMGSASWTPLANLHLLVLVAYASGLLWMAVCAPLRKGVLAKAVLAEAGMALFVLTFLEGSKQPWYLLHLVWPFAAGLAVTVDWMWKQQGKMRPLLAGWMMALLLMEAGYPALLILKDQYKNSYLASAKAVQEHTRQLRSGAVMGSAELGFALGFNRVIDDHYLGYYTHKEPEFIVVDSNYRGFLRRFRQDQPPIYRHARSLLADRYHLLFADEHYSIYTRSDL